MSARTLQLTITIVALVIVLIHLKIPTLAIDAITVALLIVAIAPWLAPILKTLELPGGLKIEFHQLEEAGDKADRAGLLDESDRKSELYSFELIADEDPNLALAGLRIEIERHLNEIAQDRNVPSKKTVSGLLRNLGEAQVLSQTERSVIADMVVLLNSAAHGAQVDERAAQWALDIGPRLLKGLTKRRKG